MTAVLETQALGKQYGRRWALQDCTLTVPEGRVRFWALIALLTSVGVSPFACSARLSMSISIWRCLPPLGRGIEAPWTVARGTRTKLSAVSKRTCSERVLLPMPSWSTGTFVAL